MVWELQIDWSAGEHDGGQCGLGAVEAVGAADDEPDFVVESFVASVGQSTVDGGGDPVSMFPDGPGCCHEFGDSAALRFRAPAIE